MQYAWLSQKLLPRSLLESTVTLLVTLVRDIKSHEQAEHLMQDVVQMAMRCRQRLSDEE